MMTEETSLQEMILGYCRQMGGLVEPPAYGIYEVLLPDEIAARWGLDTLQRFCFNTERESGDTEGTVIHYSHPLVETIIAELRQQTANGLFFINNVRLEKPGLYAAVEKAFNLPNAKMFPVHGAMPRQRLYHLVRFNFKASLISDEKRELILPVWMNLQGGYAVQGGEIERLTFLDIENQFRHLASAEPVFLSLLAAESSASSHKLKSERGEIKSVLSPEVLAVLLERTRQAALIELAPTLEGLQKRLQRFLELDRARLTEYYNDLINDVEKRLRKAEEDRHPALKAKLAAILVERQSKLADVEQKYHLRVELELVNLAVIVQPKLDLTVEIKKRTRAVQRQVVWDPLRHIVEPLVCEVCGQPGYALHLCEEGHLAHANCLSPQCVECKRTYCQKCADQVRTCVVCDRPVCSHSQVKCPQCQRVTCHDHLNDCHAADGSPRRLQSPSTPLAEQALGQAGLTVKSPAVAAVLPGAKAESGAGQKSPGKKDSSKVKAKPPPAKAKPASSGATGDYIEIYTDPAHNMVSGYVIFKRRELAARSWELTEEGISVHCHCEKGQACLAHGFIHRPSESEGIEGQMARFISSFRMEYQVPEKKVRYYHVRQGQPFDERKLKLPANWKDPNVLAAARAGFDKLRRR